MKDSIDAGLPTLKHDDHSYRDTNHRLPPQELILHDQLAEITRDLISSRAKDLFQYAPLAGYLGDPALVAELSKTHSVANDQIFVGNGSLQVLELISKCLFDPARPSVIVESPTYDRSLKLLDRLGANVCPIPLDSDGIDLNRLESSLKQVAKRMCIDQLDA